PPPGPKKKTANSPGPPGPGMGGWAMRILDDGACLSQVFGRSSSIEPAGAPAAGTAPAPASLWAEMGAGTEEVPDWLAAAAGVAEAASGAGAFLLQAQTRASSRERVRSWRSMSGLRGDGRRSAATAGAYHRRHSRRIGYNPPGGALGGWCLPRSSKPLSGAGCGVGGGFDSHALPPTP